MAKAESKLVEEVVEEVVVETTESTEAKDEFNPLAFVSDTYGELDSKKETTDNEEETVEVKSEEEKSEEEEKEQEEGWSWDKEEKEEKEEGEDYNWNEDEVKEESSTTDETLTWSKVGQELGIEITSRDDFVNALNSYAEQLQKTQQPQPVNNQVAELRAYLNYNDRDLVSEELKADGIEESEIEES